MCLIFFCFFFHLDTLFTLSSLSACHSLSLVSSSPHFSVFNKVIFLLVSLSLLFLLFCCQSEADEDSEMRTQVHWARFMALLSASHPKHKMHWAAQNHHQSLSTISPPWLLCSCFCWHACLYTTLRLTFHFSPEFTSLSVKLSLLLNTPLLLISQVLLFVNGDVTFFCCWCT